MASITAFELCHNHRVVTAPEQSACMLSTGLTKHRAAQFFLCFCSLFISPAMADAIGGLCSGVSAQRFACCQKCSVASPSTCMDGLLLAKHSECKGKGFPSPSSRWPIRWDLGGVQLECACGLSCGHKGRNCGPDSTVLLLRLGVQLLLNMRNISHDDASSIPGQSTTTVWMHARHPRAVVAELGSVDRHLCRPSSSVLAAGQVCGI